MKKNILNRFLLIVAMLMGSFAVFAGEDNMNCWVDNSVVTPEKPYLDYIINIGNDKWRDSYINKDVHFIVNGTKWTVSNFNGNYPIEHIGNYSGWVYNATQNGMTLKAGRAWKSGDDFYAHFRVYFSNVYEGQTMNYSWDTYYKKNQSSEQYFSGNGTCSVNFDSNLKLPNPTTTGSGLAFTTTAKTPANANGYRYEFFLLQEDIPASSLIGKNQNPWRTEGANANTSLSVRVEKNPSLYFVSKYYPYFTISHTSSEGFNIKCHYKSSGVVDTKYPLQGSGTSSDPFQIWNETDMDLFRQMVNLSGRGDICGKLMADVDYSKYAGIDNMIGTSQHPYSGTFDGNGKNIKMGFNVTEKEVGLFRFVKNATFTNLRLSGTFTTTKNAVGILAGRADGNTTLSYIVNNVTLSSSYSGDAALAGFVSEVGDNAVLTIKYCSFIGSMLGTNAKCSGGFVAWIFNKGTAIVENSFFAPQQLTLNADNAYTFVRYGTDTSLKVEVKNSYYIKAYGTVQGTAVTDDQMKSGEVCFMLNGSTNNNAAWLQTIGSDHYPTLWDAQRVYKIGGYYLNSMPQLKGSGTPVDPYLVGTPIELELFRNLVNKGLSTLCAKLTADIDMSDRNWVPIGRYNNDGFCGVLDGDGYCISNLSGASTEEADMGLIGRCTKGKECTVKNLLMNNVHLEGKHRCAPILGITASGSAVIENCGITGLLRFKTTGTFATGIGGIACVGSTDKVTVKNCYTVYADNILGYEHSSSSTTTNSFYGTYVTNNAKSGQLCYELNGKSSDKVVWRQTIGKQNYPQIRVGKKVGFKDNKYYNIEYVDGDNSTYSGTIASEDLKIIHHGGRLYEVIVTLGTSDGEIWHAYPNMALSYKENDSWVNIGNLLNINRERLSFKDEWSGELSTTLGLFLNSHTFQVQTPVFWINHSSNTSKKQASLLWVAPSDLKTLPREFKFSSVDAQHNLANTSVATEVAAPTDGSVTLVAPQINTNTTVPGSEMGTITLMNKAYSLGFWDATDNVLISAQEYADGTQNLQYVLPPVERTHQIVALMYGVKVVMNGASPDTTYTTYSYPFTQKPIHSIRRSNVKASYNGSNTLKWAIAFPKDVDLFPEDGFDVYRAYQSDFSDAAQIDATKLSDYSTTTTEKDTLFGWYSYKDISSEGMTTSVKYDDTKSAFDDWNLTGQAKTILTAYKYPARYIYYKVARSTINGMWGDTEAYTKKWNVLLTNVLPGVDSIHVTREKDWEKTHRVSLRLKLMNPYPYQLVPANEQQAVKEESERQGFVERMFLWDEKAKIIIKRSCPKSEWYQDVDEVAKIIEVQGNEVQYNAADGYYYVDVEDLQSAPYTHYYYEAWVDGSASSYPICYNMQTKTKSSDADANMCYTTAMAEIQEFSATRGEDDGIKVSWDFDSSLKTQIALKRKLYQCGYEANLLTTADSAAIADTTFFSGDYNANNIYDDNALAANAYQYDLEAKVTFRGKDYIQKRTAYGFKSYDKGTLSGYVRMPNGTVIPGTVKVRVSLFSPKKLKVNEVLTPDKELIMPGYAAEATVLEVQADSTGYFEVNNLCFYGNGIQYEVQAISDGVEFVGPSGTSSTIILTFEDKKRVYSNVDFVCNKTHQFSGRILYANSTVPVSDMQFTVNDIILRKTDGKPVVTDANGNFAFSVPKMKVKIQAKKAGHNLSGEGYILGGSKKDQREFIPTEDYDGLVLTDSTTIRLVGRVAGGDAEGGKVLGFGETENIIGDDITLVLQLEGDNSAFLYYNRANPEETSKDVVFKQRISDSKSTTDTIPTNVSFQSKRIVVKAHNPSGEFCLDVIPAKYKISQIYAKGYSTLYNEGEGLQVLDLTNNAVEKTFTNRDKTTKYCASYNRIYHAPIEVTLSQNNEGFFGEKSVVVNTVTGMDTFNVAWINDAKQVEYAFGYPIYKSNTPYGITVNAREVFHYNNNSLGTQHVVNIPNKEVTLINGFVKETKKLKQRLNDEGSAQFANIIPNNTTYSYTGTSALMSLVASVDVDGLAYESAPLKAYITGERDMGVWISGALSSQPKLLDIIRDPYGANSYAYREQGTSYTWSWDYEDIFKRYFQLNLSLGVGIIMSTGIGWSVGQEIDIHANFDLNTTTQHDITQKNGEYTFTFNERFATSSDPHDVGAMADVYIGNEDMVDIRKCQAFNVIGASTYEAIKASFTNGSSKVVSKGKNKEGKDIYLVISEGIGFTPGHSAMFAYSQKYILGTLIPELEKLRDLTFRKVENKTIAESLAKTKNQTYYYLENNKYVAALPPGNGVSTDSVSLYNQQIEGWQNLIKSNEKAKYDLLSKDTESTGTNRKTYSLAGTDVDYTEQASSYYRSITLKGPKRTVCSGGGGGGPANKDANDSTDKVKGVGIYFSIGLSGGEEKELTNKYSNHRSSIAGSGYHLGTRDNSTIDMDVYQEVDSSLLMVDNTFETIINNYEKNAKDDSGLQKQDGETLSMNAANSRVHNYIFVQRGGATRNPWCDADSSFFYTVEGKSVPLGQRTMRIDNPKIYVENPVVNNQPQDEAAVFTIRLANETEINDKTKYLNPSTLYLTVDEASNPDGAKLSIDGQPLRNGMPFYLNPGDAVTKTLEVKRGGKPLNYDNIKLQFTDNPDYWLLVDEATISVHYVPTSSPVNISQPANNWLMNTLSQMDENGRFFIPIQIDGFSTTQYDNFDHIELQYKKQTESEDQWVNLCSFYADTTYYNKAVGSKAMITSPDKITYSFNGEKDPIEMKYDLRAVSFCRLGNGYVSRASNVVSGTKDTRCPEVFGKAKPTNGILTFADVISLPFSEPIAYNYLDETANFSVQGYTNNSDADHSAYLYFPGSNKQSAATTAEVIANKRDFTVEMMVKADKPDSNTPERVSFLSMENSKNVNGNLIFGYMPKENRLYAQVGTKTFKTAKLSKYNIDLTQSMTHVAITFSVTDSLAHFFVGDQEIPKELEGNSEKCVCSARGHLKFGGSYKGAMADIRIWGRVLSTYELSSKYKKVISSSERNLLAYWPTDEARGSVLVDEVNGLCINLVDVVWQTPLGYSARIEGKPLQLTSKAEMKFARNNAEDFTLGFWFKCNEDKKASNSKAMLFSAGSDKLADKGFDKIRIGFFNDELMLMSEGKKLSFGTEISNLSSIWHHVAVSINHSQNIAAFFVDGLMTNELNADSLGGITSSYIAFGDTAFYGNIDNVTLWSMALPSSYINQYYNTNCTGREAELLINMNFEQTLKNEQGTPYTAFSPLNNVIVKETGKIAGDTLVDEKQVQADNKLYAPVRIGGELQNLPFSWTSNGNELQINVNKTDASINNQHLNLVVRNVEDLNGNPMKNAQMWSVYVNRNVLEWNKKQIGIDIEYGKDTTFVVGWKNTSGRIISYTIDNNVRWLQIDNVMGTMQPLSSQYASLTISGGLAPGVYSTIINLIDENNLISKMELFVSVNAKEPEWEVCEDAEFNETMNVIGIVKQQTDNGSWVIDMSSYDIVAAFVGNICLGKNYLKVDVNRNTSYIFLNVLGNVNMNNEPVEFRLWSSMDGKIYKLSTKDVVKYQAKTIVGAETPIEMLASDSKYQNIDLQQGWNWVSLNLHLVSNIGANNLFCDISQLTPGDILKKSGTQFSILQSNGKWDTTLDNMLLSESNVYQIYAHMPATIVATGSSFTDSNRSVTLKFAATQSWADLAYLLEIAQPINTALSDFIAGSDKAPAGTIIKSHDEFAVASKDGHWIGSLEYLRPGVGYYVKRVGTGDSQIVIKYTNTIPNYTNAPQLTANGQLPAANANHPTSMPIIATFAEGEYEEGDVLLAIANGEVVGAAEAQSLPTANSQQPTAEVYFLSASAENGSNLQFVKMRDGEPVAVSTKKFTYDADLVAGTLEHPYVVDFTATEGNDIYDLSGIKHFNLKSLNQRGIYIQNGRKVSR